MHGIFGWRNFGILWLGGLGILALLLSIGDELFTQAAPRGILDHQSAGTAARVDEIQESWAAIGKLQFAKYVITADLVFIFSYSLGGIIGGWLIWKEASSPLLKKLGALALAAYMSFGLLDAIETLSQFGQIISEQGINTLAALAAFVQPPKFVAFAVGFVAMVSALCWRMLENRRQSALSESAGEQSSMT